MQKGLITRYTLLWVLLSFAITESNSIALALADVPAAVQKTIESNAAGRTVANIVRTEDGGDVSYEAETTSKDGEEWDLTVAEDGTLLSMDVAFSEIPPAVQTAVNAQAGQGKLEGIEKQFDDGQVTYQAAITAPNDDERDFTFAEDGTLVSEEVNLTELPPEVQTTINTQVGQGKLEGIDKTFDDGQITYDATMTIPNGQERDFTLDEAGTLLSKEVRLTELPAEAQKTLNAQVGPGKLEGIDETFDEGTIAYEATITEPDGRDHNVTVSPKGILVSREVSLSDLPATVQNTINKQVGQGKLEGVDIDFGKTGRTYDATMVTPAGQERDFVISAQGVLLSREVSLEEVPPAAQNTITKTIGDGKIIEINQIYMIVKHTVRYEIDGQKDGKTFDFNVGPKGKVLVTEDQ